MSSPIYNAHRSAPEQGKTQSVAINSLSARRTARTAYAAASPRPEPARLATHRTPAASNQTLGTRARHGTVVSAGRFKGEHVNLLAMHHEGHETARAGPELRAISPKCVGLCATCGRSSQANRSTVPERRLRCGPNDACFTARCVGSRDCAVRIEKRLCIGEISSQLDGRCYVAQSFACGCGMLI